MGATNSDWRPEVQPGDVLSISATYDSKIASWYEVMGIMVVWEAWNDTHGGSTRLTHQVDQKSHLTHGHLAENTYYGGSAWIGVNPTAVGGVRPEQGDDRRLPISAGRLQFQGVEPVHPHDHRGASAGVRQRGRQRQGTFNLLNPNPFYLASVFHTVTSCENPCNQNYGIAYPLANGEIRI